MVTQTHCGLAPGAGVMEIRNVYDPVMNVICLNQNFFLSEKEGTLSVYLNVNEVTLNFYDADMSLMKSVVSPYDLVKVT